MCVAERREIRARRLAAEHPAPTPHSPIWPRLPRALRGEAGFRGPSAHGGACLAGGVRVCLSLLGSRRRRRSAPAVGFRARRAWHRGCPQERGPESGCPHSAAARGAARGHTLAESEGEKFASSPNFKLQRRPTRAPSRQRPDLGPCTRPAPRQAPRRGTPKVAPGGLSLFISLPAAIVASTERGMKGPKGRRSRLLAAAAPPFDLCKWTQDCRRL